jgi:hypothetical protein
MHLRYKQVDKTKQYVLLVIELILDQVKFDNFFTEIKKIVNFCETFWNMFLQAECSLTISFL